MRHHRLSWIIAAAIAVASFIPVPAAAADTSARAAAPADATTPAVVKHVTTDVDGDGTRDSVTLTYLGADQFTLGVTTTRGRTSTVSFGSAFEAIYPYTPNVAWYGASAIDGRKGSELIVRVPTTKSTVPGGPLAVYTWRSGTLVKETAPPSPWGRAWNVDTGNDLRAAGYRFFTSHGHRYVDATRMTSTGKGSAPWKGIITRSVWRHGTWVKVSTRKAKAVRIGNDLTWGQVGIAGPRLLLGQLNVDISGDGAPDLVLLYRTGARSFQARVSANGHVASAVVFPGYPDWDPFIGAAEVDGVAGREILAVTDGGDAFEWKVLGWRNNALVEVPGPLATRWFVDSDEDEVNFALSSESGSHYVVVAVTEWGHYAGQPVHFGRFVWSVGHWTMQSAWDDVLTPEQAAAFRSGFTAPDLVSP